MSLVSAVTWSRQPVTAATAADVIRYGPDIATEAELRLLGHVAAKRVLELGCGAGAGSVVMALQGARAIGVDFSAQHLSAARRLAERSGVKVELHEGDLGDLAFARADTVDVVFSVPHPAYDMIVDDDLEEPLLIRRSYFDDSRIDLGTDGPPYFGYHHTISDLFTGLSRANFRVDPILEPEPRREGRGGPHWREASRFVPRTLVMRARKEGS